jgi:hypothetical protein
MTAPDDKVMDENDLQRQGRLPCDPEVGCTVVVSTPAGMLASSAVSPQHLRFRTAEEFLSETPEDVAFVVHDYIARGVITELIGKPKEAGKTTFLLQLARAVLEGRSFVGKTVKSTPIVYLTEEGAASARAALRRARLHGKDFHLLTRTDAHRASWTEIVEAAVQRCKEVGAGLLIVDTLPHFAQLAGDTENNAGAALDVIRPLQCAADAGIAVVIVRHKRKGESAGVEGGRGSSAFTGATDTVLALERHGADPAVRALTCISRLGDPPPQLLIRLGEEGFEVADEDPAGRTSPVLEALSSSGSLTVTELRDKTGAKRAGLVAELTRLVKAGVVSKTEGSGNQGHRFELAAAVATEPIPAAAANGVEGAS